MARRRLPPKCGPGERPCPKCGNGPVSQVVVWSGWNEEEDGPWPEGQERRYGLGFAGPDGVTCCSFDEGDYASREEAEKAIAARSFEDHCVDQDMSYMADQEDLIGDQDPCGDPHPELPEY